MIRKIFMSFPQKVLGEPLIYTLGRDFNVIPNIQGATITDEMGMMALVLEGEPDKIDQAVEFLKSKGVIIESIEEIEPRSPRGR